jgi:hypothetical protein
MPCCCRKYTACESFSPKIATSTLAPVTFLLARGLDVQDGALDHALEAERRLGVDLAVGGNARRLLGDVLRQVLAQLVHVGAAGAQHFGRGGVVQQREEQVLDRDELVAFLPGFDKRHVKTDFEFLRDHFLLPFTFTLSSYYVGSITHCSGC